jgi:hypothetical protein
MDVYETGSGVRRMPREGVGDGHAAGATRSQ